MYIEKRKRGPIPLDWNEKVEKQFQNFINENNYQMPNLLFENEGSKGDPEGSYLSQIFFKKMFELFGFMSNYSPSNLYITVNDYKFYFDVMNNPNYKNPRNNKQKRMGKIIEEQNKKEYNEWVGMYHTLGNFAPYPYVKIGDMPIQRYHEAICYERWDLVLSDMKKNWISFQCPMSFAEYLIATGQIIYVKCVLEKIPKNNGLEKIPANIIYEWYKKEADDIKMCNKPIELINFNNDSNDKELDNDNVDSAIKTILSLIRVRGILLLKLMEYKITPK